MVMRWQRARLAGHRAGRRRFPARRYLMQTRIACLALLGAAASGCLGLSSVASFRGTPAPILLGPRDRVFATATPLASAKVGEFSTEAMWSFGQTREYTREISMREGALASAAYQATRSDPALDIVLTMVKPAAYGMFLGAKIKSYVTVEGDVVSRKGGAK
jgi:hypothetical protein